MTEVTINEGAKPSADLVKAAVKEVFVTDARGRKIGLRKPGILQQTRLPKVLGPELAKNKTYLEMISPVIYVTSIDDETIRYPASDREIEATIVKLDEDGLAAAVKGIIENFGEQSAEAEKEDVKK